MVFLKVRSNFKSSRNFDIFSMVCFVFMVYCILMLFLGLFQSCLRLRCVSYKFHAFLFV